jgi:hypothetical protein
MGEKLSEDREENRSRQLEGERAPATELDLLNETIDEVEDQILGHVSDQKDLLLQRAHLVDREGNVTDHQKDALLAARLTILERDIERKDRRVEQLRQQKDQKVQQLGQQMTDASNLETTAYIEGRKLNYDTFKQITTLGTGSIVILSGLAANVLKTAEWKLFLVVAVGCLFVSVISAIYAMRLTHILLSISSGPSELLDDLPSSDELERRYRLTLGAVQFSFLLGIAALLLFFIKNVY